MFESEVLSIFKWPGPKHGLWYPQKTTDKPVSLMEIIIASMQNEIMSLIMAYTLQ